MTQAITPSERQLLELVRASLWQEPVDEDLFSAVAPDWQMIGKLALQQTVGVLAFEGALSLREMSLPSKGWIQRALAFIEANRRTHILVDRCVAEAVMVLRDKGIDTVLLKGQAYARAYPKPDMRQCGDIDLYVGEENYLRAQEAAKALEWESEEKIMSTSKHYGCELHGVRIELHRIAGQLSPRSVDRKFQQWSRSRISSSGRTVNIADIDVPVPAPLFDVIFVFLHLYHHFINGGIGLRQICDWTMLLHMHKEEINLAELELRLREFRLFRAWKSLAPICVEYLGLPEAECPFYSGRNGKRGERILRMILKEGNFGRAKKGAAVYPENFFARKYHAAKQLTINHMNKLWIDPPTVLRSYCRDMAYGSYRTLRRVIKREWR